MSKPCTISSGMEIRAGWGGRHSQSRPHLLKSPAVKNAKEARHCCADTEDWGPASTPGSRHLSGQDFGKEGHADLRRGRRIGEMQLKKANEHLGSPTNVSKGRWAVVGAQFRMNQFRTGETWAWSAQAAVLEIALKTKTVGGPQWFRVSKGAEVAAGRMGLEGRVLAGF